MDRRRHPSRPALLAALAATLAALAAPPARAGLTVGLEAVFPAEGSTPAFTWEYRVGVALNDEIRLGDLIIVFDFAGYVGGSIASYLSDWDAEVELLSPDAPLEPFLADDPAVENLRFTYRGPAIVGPDVRTGFYAGSIHERATPGAFAARVTNVGGPTVDGTDVDSRGFVPVPVHAPEPATALMAGLAGGVGLAIRRR